MNCLRLEKRGRIKRQERGGEREGTGGRECDEAERKGQKGRRGRNRDTERLEIGTTVFIIMERVYRTVIM